MKKILGLGLLAGAASLTGCAEKELLPPEFEPNLVFARGIEYRDDIPMEEPLSKTQVYLDELFGTPDAPKLPDFISEDEELASLVSLEILKKAAGPVTESTGLYRRHQCHTCHGITGNGRGKLAATLATYPRDYRMGLFKFKSTEGSDKPLREDLRRVIWDGIVGTGMTKVPDMKEEDLDPLIDYVIYLSWRGQLERNILYMNEDVYLELDEDATEEDIADAEAEAKDLIEELTIEIAEDWLYAEDGLFDVPERPEFPVPDTIADVVAAAEGSELAESIKQGKEVFGSEIAGCTKCHGPEGYGNGQNKDYDNWAHDWTTKMGLNPADEDSLIPFIARGALPPKFIDPRDFRQGVFRGGEQPEDIFRRIACGIAGTPMPAAKNLSDDQKWHLVNYVRSLALPEEDADSASTPQAGDAESRGGDAESAAD
ncbi:MAG TPA: cytochrome C [Planctomycetaceae bacterium]|nr:cytochrome C [Planctomycetaceae bacterium]